MLEYGRGGVTPLLSAAEGGVGDAATEGMDGATPGLWKFGRHAGRPLDADAILVDEASMLDVELGAGLLDAVRCSGGGSGGGTSLVLVGDVDQLPPVGPGRVFGDLLASGQVHVSRLTTMFRQAAASAIKRNAAMANAGAVPTHFVRLVPGPDGGVEEEAASPSSWQASGLQPDCFFVPAPEAADVVPGVVQVALRHAMAAGASRHDVQVLAPMRRGPAGTDALNAALQAELNPHAAAMWAGGQEAPTACLPDSVRGWLASTVKLAVGDRVMQQANDYSKGVMNGDTGTVVRITWAGGDLWEEGGSLRAAWRGRRGANPRPSTLSKSARVTVRFLDGGPGSEAEVEYSLGEANARLTLAYAVTVHKAQGQEYPVVITAAHTAHYVMLSRGLLYTALSRATQAAYIVGTKPAMAVAVRNTLPARRDTQLCDILRGAGQVTSSGRPLWGDCTSTHTLLAHAGIATGASEAGTDADSAREPAPPLLDLVPRDMLWDVPCRLQAAGLPPDALHTDAAQWTQADLGRGRAWQALGIASVLPWAGAGVPLAVPPPLLPPSTGTSSPGVAEWQALGLEPLLRA